MIAVFLSLALLKTPAPKPAPPVVVTAPRMEVFNKPQEIRRTVWRGGVVAKRLDATLRCDEMVAYLTPDDQVKTATCDGHVHADKGENWVTGDRAEFDNTRGVVTVTGNPKGKQGANELQGDKILFFVDENRIEVLNSKSVLPGGEKSLQRTGSK